MSSLYSCIVGRLACHCNSSWQATDIRSDPSLCVQGAFLDSEAVNKSSSNLSADELLELLNTDKTFQDKAQSGVVSDKVFDFFIF